VGKVVCRLSSAGDLFASSGKTKVSIIRDDMLPAKFPNEVHLSMTTTITIANPILHGMWA